MFGHPRRTYMSTWFCYAKLGATYYKHDDMDGIERQGRHAAIGVQPTPIYLNATSIRLM